MNHTGTVEIVTPRLVLRQAAPDDTEACFENWQSDDAVTRFMSWNTMHCPGESLGYILKLLEGYRHDDFYDWIITLDGIPVGGIGAKVNVSADSAEIGYCLGQQWWNNGYMTEALGALIAHMLGVVGLHRIYAKHALANGASGRVMQKCGMRPEGILRESCKLKDGSYTDMVYYGLLQDEWRMQNDKQH